MMTTTKARTFETGPAPDKKSFVVIQRLAILLYSGILSGCAHHYQEHLELQGCTIDSAISWTCPWEIRQ